MNISKLTKDLIIATSLLGIRFGSTLLYSYFLFRESNSTDLINSIYFLLYLEYVYGMVGYVFRNALLFNSVRKDVYLIIAYFFSITGAVPAFYFSNDIGSRALVVMASLMFPFYTLFIAETERISPKMFSSIESVASMFGVISSVFILFYGHQLLYIPFNLGYRSFATCTLVVVACAIFVNANSRIYVVLKEYMPTHKKLSLKKEEFCLLLNSAIQPGLIYLSSLTFLKYITFLPSTLSVQGVMYGFSRQEFIRAFAALYDPVAALCGITLRWKLLKSKNNPSIYFISKIKLIGFFTIIAVVSYVIWLIFNHYLAIVIYVALVFINLAAFQATLIFAPKRIEFGLSLLLIFMSCLFLIFNISYICLAPLSIILMWLIKNSITRGNYNLRR